MTDPVPFYKNTRFLFASGVVAAATFLVTLAAITSDQWVEVVTRTAALLFGSLPL